MNKNINRIKNILNNINRKNSINIDQMSSIMLQTRQIIEFEKLKEEYKFLNLYCNWLLHTQLQDSKIIYYILEEANKVIFQNPNRNGNDTNCIIKQISTLLSIENLKNDFIKIYKLKKLPIFLFDNQENWRKFISLLLLEISDKPLKFPEKIKEKSAHKGFKKAYKVYSKMRNSSTVIPFSSTDTPSSEPAFVQGLTIISNNKKGYFEIQLSLWDEERTSKIHINLPLIIKEVE